MHVPTMSRTDLELAILFDDELYNKIELEHISVEDYLQSKSIDELRDILTEWIINNDETY